MDTMPIRRHHHLVAKTTITHITDDLDGSKDASEVAFSLHGVDYVIDLSKKNASALEKALKPYLDAATKVGARGSSPRRARTTGASGSRKDYAKIREWARSQGLEVSSRGRIPANVVEQYQAAK